MVVENLPVPIFDWLQAALPAFLLTVGLLSLALLVIGYLVVAFRYGPLEGGDITFKFVKSFFLDLVHLSPRRISALAWLAIQESIRRRVLVAFAVFVLILLFAGWFLDTGTSDPSTLYLSFVLTATTYLVLLLGLFLSAFSLPTDIKNRTIYTIVTKPVRPGEIVLGRILGFTMIGTLLLAIMGLMSYFFVIRVLDHTHEVDTASLVDASSSDPAAGKTGRTSLAHNHRHEVRLEPDGNGYTTTKQGHSHQITATTTGDKTTYAMSGPQGMLTARVPIYGDLRYLERDGKPGKGISVGYEWAYRRYLEGGTQAAAVWTFHDVTPENYPDGLPIEMTIRVFRTYKGNVERGILGSIRVKNPSTGRSSAPDNFTAKDGSIDYRNIAVKLKGAEGEPLELFKDLVSASGDVEIWVECLERAQYYGVARPDLYLRAPDGSFRVNFIKAYLGIWLQMVLVTSFGVMFSTLLSGPVAMMATLSSLVIGFFTKFVFELASGKAEGGGPIESLVRIVKQQNMVSKLDDTLGNNIMQWADFLLLKLLSSFASLLPDFRQFTNIDYVAHGFDVPPDLVLRQGFGTLAYLLAAVVIGYFFLKSREVAR